MRSVHASVIASMLSLFALVACSSSSGDGTGTDTSITANDGGGATGADGKKDGSETDIDCGGDTAGAPRCVAGSACIAPTDCTSGVCTSNACAVPTHTDGVKNGDETGVDCGGPTSNKLCADGAACKVAATDCTSGVCTGDVCIAASHGDGVKNGDETGVDCGGPTANKPCADLQACTVGQGVRDCTSQICTGSICQVPTDSDGVKNGTETDLDCGGAAAKSCLAGKACVANTDCSSKGCNIDSKTCAWGRSCISHHGNDTCGVGDETFARAADAAHPVAATMTSGTKDHHDCCESAIVNPDGVAGNADDFRLDKYQITAGRMRRFIEATGGNVRGWVQNARGNLAGESFMDPVAATQLPATFDQYLPLTLLGDESAPTVPPNDGRFHVVNATSAVNVTAHLGGYRFTTEPGGDAGYGCTIATGAYGARTYRLEANQLSLGGERQHALTQERLDEKSLTCVDYYMLAAFCAWDGGRLETKSEHDIAWGPHARPWGDDTGTQGFNDALSVTRYRGDPNNTLDNIDERTAANIGNFNRTWLERVNGGWNYSNYVIQDRMRFLTGRTTVYAFTGETEKSYTDYDQSYGVAPPGRYPSGAGPWAHQDLLGNVIEITATGVPAGSGISYQWTKNGSYEEYVHWNGNNPFDTGYDGFQFSGMTKYGRAGGRCARPIAQP